MIAGSRHRDANLDAHRREFAPPHRKFPVPGFGERRSPRHCANSRPLFAHQFRGAKRFAPSQRRASPDTVATAATVATLCESAPAPTRWRQRRQWRQIPETVAIGAAVATPSEPAAHQSVATVAAVATVGQPGSMEPNAGISGTGPGKF